MVHYLQEGHGAHGADGVATALSKQTQVDQQYKGTNLLLFMRPKDFSASGMAICQMLFSIFKYRLLNAAFKEKGFSCLKWINSSG